MIQWVGFDLDDTLFNGTLLVRKTRRASVRNMINYGLQVDEEYALSILYEIVAEFGSNYPSHLDILLQRLKFDPKVKLESDSKIALYVAAGIIGYHSEKLKYFQLYPDVLPTLQTLKKRGIKLVLITDGYPKKQYEKIIRLGLIDWFDEIVISDEIGIRKPNVKLFQAVLNKIGATPEQLIYVGDRLDKDIEPANQAGLTSILIHRGTKYDPELKEFNSQTTPDYHLYKLYDLLNIVAKHNNE